MTDHKGLPDGLAIGRLAVTPAGRVYASSSDPESTKYGVLDAGLFWSDDDGVVWTRVATNSSCVPASTPPIGTITRILIHPNDPNTVYVSSKANVLSMVVGVFRTNDGGRCWTNILPNQQVFDMALVAQDKLKAPYRLYAALLSGSMSIGTSIRRTQDPDADPAALQWEDTLSDSSTAVFSTPPTRIALAASKNTVYALVAQGPMQATTGQLMLFRATGDGSWVQRSEPRDLSSNNRCDGQCPYNLALAVSPTREDDIAVGTVTVLRSTDGGQAWSELNPGFTSLWDHHCLVHDPNDPDVLFSGNDAGIQKIRLAPFGGTERWTWLNRDLSIGLFESLTISPLEPTRSSGGLQDLGTQIQQSGRTWSIVEIGSDGFRSVFDAGNPYMLYSTLNYFNGNGLFERGSGGTHDRVGNAAEFWSDPVKGGVLLASNPVVPPSSRTAPRQGLYYATGVDTASTIAWTCLDPTATTAIAGGKFSGAIAFLPTGGRYLVGSTLGTVFRVTAPTGSPASECSGDSAVNSSELWTAPPKRNSDASTVVGLTNSMFPPSRRDA
jgi:hypothetical protein